MANDINKVVLIGNIVRDCDGKDFSYTQSGTCIAKVSIAVNRGYTQNGQKNEMVSYFDITIFGKTAEALKPYLTKGKKICVSGYLKQDRWTDQQGNNRSRVGVVAEDIQLLGGKNDQQGQNAQRSYQSQAQYQPQSNQNNNQQSQYQTVQPVQQFSQNSAQQSPYQQQAQYQQPQLPQNEMGFPEDIPF